MTAIDARVMLGERGEKCAVCLLQPLPPCRSRPHHLLPAVAPKPCRCRAPERWGPSTRTASLRMFAMSAVRSGTAFAGWSPATGFQGALATTDIADTDMADRAITAPIAIGAATERTPGARPDRNARQAAGR